MSERDLAGEFRALADALLDRIEPMISRMDDPEAPHWQGCSWCPLCAAAALLRGERHELLTRAGLEMDSVLALLRDVLGDHQRTPDAASTPDPHLDLEPDPPAPDPGPRGRYVPITVTITETGPPT